MMNEDLLNIKSHYRTGTSDLGKEFFGPCLNLCCEYRRAVGFFSSSALCTWADALPRIASPSTATIKLLASPTLSKEDFEAIKMATSSSERSRLRQISADKFVLDAIEFASNPISPENKKLELLAWMIANERLIIKFAFPEHVSNAGIFHEKIGIFDFASGETVAFTGSANESISGHSNNYETIDVYRSWENSDKERVNTKIEQFDESWDNLAYGLTTLPLSVEALEKIKVRAPLDLPMGCEGGSLWGEPPLISDKWRHQEEAKKVFMNIGSGVLEMATGTGKTRTALKILGNLVNEKKINGVVITTDGTDLLDQWCKEIGNWNLNLPQPMAIYKHYGKYHELVGFSLSSKGSILVVSRGNLKKLFQMFPASSRERFIIIHDEVHGLGALSNCKDLAREHESFSYRLGLSATPDRVYDETGTKFITSEIGDVVYTFGLVEAIERGILCEFEYIPLPYELTEDDRDRLSNIYKKKSARAAEGNPMSKEEVWTAIAMVYKTAEAKPGVFELYLPTNPDCLNSSIIFVETKEYGERLLPMLHKYTHKYRTYFAEDEKQNLVDFSKGKIDCLLTCHRISQGIDIQKLKNVILFSSARARLETIQRIGRCLRVDPENPSKSARIIDFVRPQGDDNTELNADQDRYVWLTKLSKTRRN